MFTDIMKLNPTALSIQLKRLKFSQLETLRTAISTVMDKQQLAAQFLTEMEAKGLTLEDLGATIITPEAPVEAVDSLAEFIKKTPAKKVYAKLKTIESKIDMGEKLIKLISNGTKAVDAEKQLHVSNTVSWWCRKLFRATSKFQNKIGRKKSSFDYGKFKQKELLDILNDINQKESRGYPVNANNKWTVYKSGTDRVLVIENGKVLFLTHEKYNGYVSNGHR